MKTNTSEIHISKDIQGRVTKIVIKEKSKEALSAEYSYLDSGLNMILRGNKRLIPNYSQLLSLADAKFTERIAVIDSQPSIEKIDYLSWLTDGNYAISWEEGFYQPHFHGRMGPYFRSESGLNLEREKWTLPEIILGDNIREPTPWQSVLRMRNSKDGVTPDHIYVGFPKAMYRGVMVFAANLPHFDGVSNQMYIGWEITSGGSWANLVALWRNINGWYLRAIYHSGSVLVGPFNLRHEGVYARYALEYDPPNLRLWETIVGAGNEYAYPLQNSQSLALGAQEGKLIPFFANEDDTAVSEFRVSRVWIYEKSPYGNKQLWATTQSAGVVMTAAVARYLFMKGPLTVGVTAITSNRVKLRVPKNGVFLNLRVYGIPSANSAIVLMQLNGFDSALSATMTGGAAEGEFLDSTHSIAVTAGDLVDWEITCGAAAPTIHSISVEYKIA